MTNSVTSNDNVTKSHLVMTSMVVEPWKGKIATDSQNVLNTLGGGDVDPQEARDVPINIDGATAVLDVLCPDWDNLIEIQH
jgi:hypothetical protein